MINEEIRVDLSLNMCCVTKFPSREQSKNKIEQKKRSEREEIELRMMI